MDYELALHESPQPRLDLSERPTRLLHVMLRVRNLARSMDFYIGALGLRMLRRQDYPSGRFTLVFLGYGEEAAHTVLELTHNWDQDEPYELGTGYGHIALAVNDVYAACGELAEAGVKITRPPGPMKHSDTLMAFVEDPDGYRIELIGCS
ncbi:Lactoylglutathione lyase [Variovorax sp. PBL-H6]|uniref:lactoylglutathione lyase n=1 Tax=Variovorax sp. PBL-H6 TaxID=434009 RepID=UPI00131663E4|nr:lactoylglutathione lyase [Variovorax sp. PBL-H6]VTU23806.1 Lactoylglutathione lyase [Variovorax sp. PBL-H6]